ncbi:MAG: tetratricopeptide repeat protein [Pseudomonadota bacterium]
MRSQLVLLALLTGCTTVTPQIDPNLEQRALAGDMQAQYAIGKQYVDARYSLRGKDEHWDGAVKWFALAADQGDPRAQYYLGLHAANVMRNYEPALEFYQSAAMQGIAEAQYALGMLYGQAWGTEQNLVLAYKWIALANRGGVVGGPLADTDWLVWKAGMNNSQIAEGKELVAEHVATYGESQSLRNLGTSPEYTSPAE